MSKAIENQFAPDYVSPPGDTLLETLEAIGMSQAELAERTGRPRKTINEIIRGKAAITPATALQFEKVLNIPATFWNNRERFYREHMARIQERERLTAYLEWLRGIPVKDMIQKKWIQPFKDKIQQLQEVLRFFGVASPEQWRQLWCVKQPTSLSSGFHYLFSAFSPLCQMGGIAAAFLPMPISFVHSFRKSPAFRSDPGALAAWLRKGEIDAQQIRCAPYDKGKFRSSLRQIRSLTVEPPEVFQPKMVQPCAEAGVAVVFVPELPKTRASGATRWLSPVKALIQLSLRHKSDDQLWFSFFHEAAHILLHGKQNMFIEGIDGNDGNDRKEQEANKFAEEFLIPSKELQRFLKTGNTSKLDIQRFASDLGIAPGSVVGRLQHQGIIPRSHYNDLKRWFAWGDQ